MYSIYKTVQKYIMVGKSIYIYLNKVRYNPKQFVAHKMFENDKVDVI